MKLHSVNKSKIYIESQNAILEIDVSKNQLLDVVKENNFSNVELELFLKEYNKGVELILGEKITPERSNWKYEEVKEIVDFFDNLMPSVAKKIK
jgi:hypothetical protein